LLISTSTGAPAAFALAEGIHDDKNGHATKPTPTAPTTLVALVRKRLFFKSISCPDIRLLSLLCEYGLFYFEIKTRQL
jgi:hypothetical protein